MKKKISNQVKEIALDGYEAVINHRVIVGLLLIAATLMAASIYIFLPTNVAYSFSNKACVGKLTLLPNLHKTDSSKFYKSNELGIKLAGVHLVSGKTCYQLSELTPEGEVIEVNKHYFGQKWLTHSTKIHIEQYPKVDTSFTKLESVPINSTLTFKLDKKDSHFEYLLKVNKAKSECQESGSSLDCDISSLGLIHDTKYSAQIKRTYLGQQSDVATFNFNTVQPVSIIKSSVNNGAQLTSKLTKIELQTDKNIKSVENVKLSSGKVEFETNVNFKKKNIEIGIKDELPRDRDYQLSIEQIIGDKDESLTEKFVNTFYLAPGPSVTGMSLNDRATPLGANIKIYFDQTLSKGDYSKKINLTQNGQSFGFNVNQYGSSLTINPIQNFNKCAEIKISINGDIANNYGITKDVNWAASSRATCASSFSIGRSVQGRNIVGHSFGSGAREILYVAAIHGDESNSKRLLDRWLWELEGDPGRIPNGTKVSVIPVLNPDAFASGSRFNANRVDLNRNFPANNWKSDVVIQGGSILENGGGEEPLSEPESNAIASYISSRRPYLVLTYHSQGGIVESNESGVANSKAGAYTNLSGYGYKLASQNAGFFKYDINGSLEEWAHDKLAQPVLLIELSSSYYHEFSRNRAAMWAMLE